MTDTHDRRVKYIESVNRALKWILTHQQPDGGFGPEVETLSHYMAIPGALLYTGHPRCAAKLIPYMKQQFVSPDGSIFMPEYATGRAMAVFEHCYAPSWLVFGMHLNLAFEVSLPAMPHILKFQDPQTGGMFGSVEDKEGGKGLISAPVTCIAGQAALTTGYIAEAKRMGDHLIHNVIENNPDLSKEFYPCWDTERGLRTDPKTPSFPNMPRVIVRDQPAQHHYLTGMIIAYFSDLYRATSERKYLDAAETIYEFASGNTPYIYENTLSHKFAWGCAWLYRVTGKAEHLESACKVCDYLVSIQEEEGSFVHYGLVKSADEWPFSPRLNTTSQFALWINRTASLL
ncbi:MAG: prenyltransferase/squalene oxidase repeat-containing protein [Armatimonadota bacterium]|nr:prenyltransferase/squalene oxidase repeat-containing protein [Armatimonadota bacterium]